MAPIIVLRGARQVGKTTLQEQIIDKLVREDSVPPARAGRISTLDLGTLLLREKKAGNATLSSSKRSSGSPVGMPGRRPGKRPRRPA